jgi:hypothetical protein
MMKSPYVIVVGIQLECLAPEIDGLAQERALKAGIRVG